MGVLDDFLASAKPRSDEVTVCARGDLVDRHHQLVDKLAKVLDPGDLEGHNPEEDQLQAAIRDVEKEMDQYQLVFTLQSIGGRWADVLSANGPTDEQRALGYDNDPASFQPAAVAACTLSMTMGGQTDNGLSVERARELRKVLDEGEWAKLFGTASVLNRTPMPNPKLRAATEPLPSSEPSSTTSSPEESLEDASSVSGAPQ